MRHASNEKENKTPHRHDIFRPTADKHFSPLPCPDSQIKYTAHTYCPYRNQSFCRWALTANLFHGPIDVLQLPALSCPPPLHPHGEFTLPAKKTKQKISSSDCLPPGKYRNAGGMQTRSFGGSGVHGTEVQGAPACDTCSCFVALRMLYVMTGRKMLWLFEMRSGDFYKAQVTVLRAPSSSSFSPSLLHRENVASFAVLETCSNA